MTRRQRGRVICLHVIHLRADLPADLQQVLKALGRDHRDRGALALEQGIGRHRRAVGQASNLIGLYSRRIHKRR